MGDSTVNVVSEYDAVVVGAGFSGLYALYYLRDKLGYKGLVVSDDLLMEAIRQRYGVEEASILALQASVDMLLISQNQGRVERGAAERVLAAVRNAIANGRLSPKALAASIERVRVLRSRIPK